MEMLGRNTTVALENDDTKGKHLGGGEETLEVKKVTVKDEPAETVSTSSLKISKVSPPSIALNAFMGSIVFAVVLVAVVVFSWHVLDHFGIFTQIIDTIAPPESGDGGNKLAEWLALSQFVKIGTGLAISLVVVIPVLSFFGAIIYNLIARISGGVRVNLSHKTFTAQD